MGYNSGTSIAWGPQDSSFLLCVPPLPYHSGGQKSKIRGPTVLICGGSSFWAIDDCKERILKAAREKETVTYRGVPISLSADFSKETLQARRGWEVFQVVNGKDLHTRLFYPAKLSFRMDGQIKCFPDKVKFKEFIITKPLLYEMLKGLI